MYPYGTAFDTIDAYNLEESSLLNESQDGPLYAYPYRIENLINRTIESKHISDRWEEKQKKTDEYRGKYASSLLPFKQNSNSNDILSQLWRWYSRKKGFLAKQQKPILSGRGADIIDLSKNVIRLTPDSKQSTALFNEFVEQNNPSIMTAGDYQSGKITHFGDHNIPVENISLYAGIENGRFKLDSLKNFDPNTVVFPARNIKRSIFPITKFNIEGLENTLNNSNWQNVSNITNYTSPRHYKDAYKYNTELDTSAIKQYADSVANVVDNLLDKNKLKEAYAIITRNDPNNVTDWTGAKTILRAMNEQGKKNWYLANYYAHPKFKEKKDSLSLLRQKYIFKTKEDKTYSYIDTKGEEYPVSTYNASILDNKTIFANPNGGIFIGRIQDISPMQRDSLNSYLSKNPSYLLRMDLGSFNTYDLNNPTAKEYLQQYFEHPSQDDPNVFIVGTTEPNKLW